MTKNDPQLLTMFTHRRKKKLSRGHLMNSTEKFKTLGACQDGEDLTVAPGRFSVDIPVMSVTVPLNLG